MKKILFGMFTILGIGISFCSANSCVDSCSIDYDDCLDVCSGMGSEYSSCVEVQCIPNYNDCVSLCNDTGTGDSGIVNTNTTDGYINVLNNSFGLFQYYFWELVQVLPFILLITGFILMFYMIIKK